MTYPALLALIGMTLLQCYVTLSGFLSVAQPQFPQGMTLTMLAVFCTTCFTSLLLGWASERKTRRDATAPESDQDSRSFFAPLRSGLAFLLLPLLAVIATRLAYPEPWQTPGAIRYFSQAGLGMFYVAGHWVFFSLTDKRHQGLLFCAAFLASVIFTELFSVLLYRTYPGIPSETLLAVGYSLTTLLLAPLFVILAWGGLLMWGCPGFDGWLGEKNYSGPAARQRPVRNALCAIAAFYLLNALVQGAFFPYAHSTGLRDNQLFILLLACVCLPLLGRSLTVNPGQGMRTALMFCAAVFVMTPAFSTFVANPVIYRMVHALAVIAYWTFHICMTIMLAQSVWGKWRLFALLLPHLGRMLSLSSFPALEKVLFPHRELTLAAAVLVAAGFYLLINRLRFLPGEEEKYGDGESRTGDAAPPSAADPAGLAGFVDKRIRAMAETHAFSSRETEVAILLAHGLTAQEISQQMELSLNTVNTYIRRVLKKCGGIRRKDFVGRAFREDWRHDETGS